MAALTVGTGRAVEVLHDRGPAISEDVDRWTSGSGYLIGGRLVLTAAHTVDYRQDLGQEEHLLVRTEAEIERLVQEIERAKMGLRPLWPQPCGTPLDPLLQEFANAGASRRAF